MILLDLLGLRLWTGTWPRVCQFNISSNESCDLLKAELPALHGILDVHILNLRDKIIGAGIAIVILVGAVDVMVYLKKTTMYK